MRIGFHTWDPGLTSSKPNSAGGSLWIKRLMRYISDGGHEILWFGEGEPNNMTPAAVSSAKDVDLLILFWRWKMDEKYKDRNEARIKQNMLLSEAIDANVPILIHDQDHKMEPDEIKWLKSEPKVTLASPELKPRDGFIRLMYPNPYPIPINPLANRLPFYGEISLIYIGNNYERWDQFVEYICGAAPFLKQTKVFGNWMEPGPGRQSPNEVKRVAQAVKFGGRLPQANIIEQLVTADFTVHLAKPSYCKTGFVTMRWCEAAMAGTYAFLPAEFKHVPDAYNKATVSTGEKLAEKINSMEEKEWVETVIAQQEWVKTNMTTAAWYNLIQELGG